jgi:hypothetical protein
MIDITGYAPSCWSERAQRLFNLATYAHFKACDLYLLRATQERRARADWYKCWSGRLYAVFGALPASETPPYEEE